MSQPLITRRALKLAAVAVAGACIAGVPTFAQDRAGGMAGQDQQDQAQRQRPGQSADLPRGIRWSEEPADADDVRGVIGDIAGAAVTDDGFDDLVERLVDQDRNRIGEWLDEGDNREFAEMNQAAERFRQAYQEKFGEEFSFEGETALAGITARQGEIEDPEVVASNWPVPASPGMDRGNLPGQPRVAGGEDPVNDQGNLEEGRQVAIVTLPAQSGQQRGMQPGQRSGAGIGEQAGQAGDRAAARAQAERPGMAGRSGQGQEIKISLVNEMPGAWKVDVPNDRQPEQIYRDITQRLDRLSQSADQWPSEKSQVHHKVAYEVLSAIYGVGGQQRPGMDRGMDQPQRDRDPGRDDSGMGGGGMGGGM